MPSIYLRTLVPAMIVFALAGCSADVPTADLTNVAGLPLQPASGRVRICHQPGYANSILEVGVSALPALLAHGDYITTFQVSHASQPTDPSRVTTIGDALAAARASRAAAAETHSGACRITILAAAGTYQGTTGSSSGMLEHFPLIVDMPDITLHGQLVMMQDWSGQAVDGVESVLAPVDPLPVVDGVSTPIVIANAHSGASAADGLVVEGFVFQSGHDPEVDAGGQGIFALRASHLTIRGNRFEGGFTESIDLRAGSSDVIGNHLSGTAGTCDMCLAGPGTFLARDNVLLSGGIPGIAVSPTVRIPEPAGVEPYVLPEMAETWANINGNVVRDHQRLPVGVGIRIDAVGVGAASVHGTVHADIEENLIANNRFGIIVHAAFPTATTDRRGDVDMTLDGNEFEGSCEANLLVAFARHTTVLGLANTPYLLNSTFQLNLGQDLSWADVWYGHPAGFGNTLVVNGVVIDNGSRQSYNPAPCPAS